MNHLSDSELLSRTQCLVAEERSITLSLIEHLQEINQRKLYAELGYGSLWEFATKRLGLSEGAAQRRIQAMRLVRDVPEAKEKLRSGSLSLSNAAKVQSFRQAEKKLGRVQDATALIEKVSNLSQRECEQELFKISPEALPQERERVVSGESFEIKLVISKELHEKLQRLKGLLAHAIPEASYAELLEHLANQELARLEKKKGIAPSSTAAAAVEAALTTEFPKGKRVYLPVTLTRPIWQRAQGRCEIVTHGRRCESRYRLEVDHIEPLSRGGSNAPGNLRLACWHHNQWLARKAG